MTQTKKTLNKTKNKNCPNEYKGVHIQQKMAALAREVYHPMARYVKKQVFGIRHGEAWHNILHSKLGDDAYNNFQDATLTTRGMSQASSNATSMPAPDLILVSPLMRTLQTADIIWPNTPKVALECLQEYPQQTFLKKYTRRFVSTS
jgi:hypothetical protein